jgi:RNA polymerase sigma-70 factor (ECF subfamily)
MPESDAVAVARAQAGDPDAFRDLVDRHSRRIYRLAFRITGSAQDAEDVVQEAFLRAYRQLDRFESRANFGTWLHRITVNCSIDLMRSRPRREEPQDEQALDGLASPGAAGAGLAATFGGGAPSGDPERLAFSAEIQERVTDAMDRLSPMERAAFTLRHFEGLSIDEIGRTLNLRTNATKHSIFRAVRKMRSALEPFITADERR